MSIFLGIFLTLAVFFIVVFIHELGHFWTARWSGVKVHEFGIGIPPRLKRIFCDKKGTEWTLNWLPIGGFVRLKGEDVFAPESQEKDALPQAKWWKQVIILLAGVTMNFILAGVIFSALFWYGTKPLIIHVSEMEPDSLISQIEQGTHLIKIYPTLTAAQQFSGIESFISLTPQPESVAEKAGIQPDDILVAINDTPVKVLEDVTKVLQSGQISHVLQLRRGTEDVSVSVEPINGKIGVVLDQQFREPVYQYGLVRSVAMGFSEVGQQVVFSFRMFGKMLVTAVSPSASSEQKQEVSKSFGGPVAIGKMFVGFADHGISIRGLVVLMAMISISLGVFNLLPFPALDGGRCLIVVINQAIHCINPRYKISPKTEQAFHAFGFLCLLLMALLVTIKDIFG